VIEMATRMGFILLIEDETRNGRICTITNEALH
jgi:hypothetical protein